MRSTKLHFIKGGLQTLIQDMGRPDYRAMGVPVGGALDRSSAIIANRLVSNKVNAPVLEITVSGPTVQFEGATCLIAITGADISPTLNGAPIEMYRSIQVTTNSKLSFGKLNSGCRAYLAVMGDWQISTWLNSASAIFQENPDVTPDSFIVKGKEISIHHGGKFETRVYPPSLLQRGGNTHVVRLLPGPEFDMFDHETHEKFFNQVHKLSSQSNRWAYRLDSQFKISVTGQEMISSAVLPGTIQIPHSGIPMVLMADAQTTGGYPRIAVVISADMDILAQAKPGDSLVFKRVNHKEALRVMASRSSSMAWEY